MENFITGHLLCEEVDVYCGGSDNFKGKVVACSDGVLTIESGPGVYTHIAIGKIVAIWRKAARAGTRKAQPKLVKVRTK